MIFESSASTQVVYEDLCAAFADRALTSPKKRGFGGGALVAGGRIFAMLAHDRLVVKLPRARVDQLVTEGLGVRFDANKGRPMKEWLSIEGVDADLWRRLAEEGLAFAQSAR